MLNDVLRCFTRLDGPLVMLIQLGMRLCVAPCKRIHEGPGFRILAYSGFQQQKFAGFRIPDSLTWGDLWSERTNCSRKWEAMSPVIDPGIYFHKIRSRHCFY